MNSVVSSTWSMRLVLPLIMWITAACTFPASPSTPASSEAPTVSNTSQQRRITVTTTNAPDDNNPLEVARFQQLLEAFKQIRPDVVIEARQGSWDKQAFAARLAAGTMEDAYLVPFTEPQALIARGYAADLTALMHGWEHFKSFNPAVLPIVQDEQERLYGIPVAAFAQGLIYNRKLFQAAGLDPNYPPTTWAELRTYAKRLTDPNTGRAGFAELSKGNQGGWHFTTWLYSFGGDAQQQREGQWRATFNSDAGVKALQTLKDMRWTDRSMTEQQFLEVKDVLALLATERVAMAIVTPDALRSLKTQYQANIEDFGMGALPQAGGDATLVGGTVWMFNPRSTPEVIQAAVEWTIYRDFHLAGMEMDLKGQQQRGQLVGWPQIPLFSGAFQEQRDALVARYANAPIQNYRPYLDMQLRLRPAPPIEPQKMYALLDPVMQAILTDPNTDPKVALDSAAQQFQSQVLDLIER
jgi:multiple sugar transport system substrate-binding protein